MPVAVSVFDIKTAIRIFTDECWRPWYTFNVPHYYLFPPGDVRCVVVTTSLSSKERFEVLPSTYFDKGVSPLRDGGGGSALGSRLCLLYLKQKSSAHLPNLSKDQAGRVTWQVLTRGTPLDHSCGRVAKLALERRRVQQRCPRAPTPEPGKGRRPKNRHSSKAKRVSARVFCLLPVLACLWRGFPGSGSLVLRPCPFGFLFVLFRLMFLFLGRGRHVPAPSGRDVGSSAGAPTQEPELGTDPRTGFFRYPSTYVFLVNFVAPALFFPFLFATLFSRMCLSFGMLSGYPRLLTIGLKLSSVWIGEVLFCIRPSLS